MSEAQKDIVLLDSDLPIMQKALTNLCVAGIRFAWNNPDAEVARLNIKSVAVVYETLPAECKRCVDHTIFWTLGHAQENSELEFESPYADELMEILTGVKPVPIPFAGPEFNRMVPTAHNTIPLCEGDVESDA